MSAYDIINSFNIYLQKQNIEDGMTLTLHVDKIHHDHHQLQQLKPCFQKVMKFVITDGTGGDK